MQALRVDVRLGERPLERSPVERPAVRREHVLDRQVEQRAQALGDLLARHGLAQPLVLDPQALPEVGQRVAGDHRALGLDPQHDVVLLAALEHVDLEWQILTRQVEASGIGLPEPEQVGTAVSGLLGGTAGQIDTTSLISNLMVAQAVPQNQLKDQLTTVTKYGVTGYPETFFVNRRGKLVGNIVGALKADELSAGIHDALQ